MRKLFSASVAVALAFMLAGAGAAQASVARDGATGQVCSEPSVTGNTVTGGCLVEDMWGTWNIANPSYVVDSCSVNYDMRWNGSATTYYAVDQYVVCNWPYRACRDNVTGAVIPWQGQGASMAVCLEIPSNGTDNWAPVSWEFTFGPSGELYTMHQTSGPQGVGGAYLENGGEAYDEILVTDS